MFLEFRHVSQNEISRLHRQTSTLMNQCTNDDCERFTEGDYLPGTWKFKKSFEHVLMSLKNGVGAFILQCHKLSFHYCDWAGSSRGMKYARAPLNHSA